MYDELDYDALLGEDIEYFEPETELIGRRRSSRSRPTPFAMQRGRGRSRGRSPRGRSVRMRAPAATRALMAGNIAPGVPRPGAAILVLGFGNMVVPVGSTSVSVSIRPQRPILVRRLTIVETPSLLPAPPTTNAAGLVTVFNVGVNSQFVGTSGVPTAAFGPLATDIVLAGDVATPGVDITLTITCTDPTAVGSFFTFQAALYGESLT